MYIPLHIIIKYIQAFKMLGTPESEYNVLSRVKKREHLKILYFMEDTEGFS